MRLPDLYRCARQNKIPVCIYPMARCGSMSVKTDAGCVIGMDPSVLRHSDRARTHLSHELGHCLTGSFYNVYTPHDVRRRHENRADKWAIETLIPLEALDEAVAEGVSTVWELSERFGVTEEMMRKAVCYYVHGNLATELYF